MPWRIGPQELVGLRQRLCSDAIALLEAFAARGISDDELARADDPAMYNGACTVRWTG
jgi:hypothetical protein